MKKKLVFEFEEEGPAELSYEMLGPPTQKAATALEQGIPTLYVNKEATNFEGFLKRSTSVNSGDRLRIPNSGDRLRIGVND
jgi:hypothetical protein